MPQITWILTDSSRISDDVVDGTNLMDAAQFAGVQAIAGECGGCLSCATCHVVVEPAWRQHMTPMQMEEDSMLDAASVPRQTGSRLSCQLIASAALDGLELRIPT